MLRANSQTCALDNDFAIGELLSHDDIEHLWNSPGITAAVEQHRPSSKRAKLPTPPRGNGTSRQPKRVRPALGSRFDSLQVDDDDGSAADRIAAEGRAADKTNLQPSDLQPTDPQRTNLQPTDFPKASRIAPPATAELTPPGTGGPQRTRPRTALRHAHSPAQHYYYYYRHYYYS